MKIDDRYEIYTRGYKVDTENVSIFQGNIKMIPKNRSKWKPCLESATSHGGPGAWGPAGPMIDT